MKAFASMQARLLAMVVGVVLAAWMGAAAWSVAEVRHEIDELLDAHLAQAAALLIAQQAPGDDDDRTAEAPVLHRYAPRVAFQVWHEGTLMLRSANAPREPMAGHRSGFASVALDARPWRVFAARGAENDMQVYVGESIAARDEILEAVLKGMFVPLALALPVIGLLAVWAVRRGLAPLRALTGALLRRSPAALAPVQLPHTPSELHPVTQALNELFARIARLLEAERRFTADAAHELRTPIAAIAAQAQVALAAEDDATRRQALQHTLAGCERASRLVQQMLTLARLENASGPPAQPLDLAALVRHSVAELLPAADARGQTVELEAPDRLPAESDDALLGVLVRNLVDNAIRHTPAGARVLLTLSASGRHWQLLVEDSGPGLAEPERARLGERFFRVTGTEAAGSGLGWSIVRRIAGVLRLEVEAGRSPALGGLRVAVRGPVG